MRAGRAHGEADELRRFVAAFVIAAALVAFASCSSNRSVGPLTIVPPPGWLVTTNAEDSIKISNGTVADDLATKPGSATAVFDIYTTSNQTVAEFEAILKKNNVKPKEERLSVGGYPSTIVSYPTSYFGPSTDVVFVPDWHVQIVYRAAYPDDESAFSAYKPAFRSALRTIHFSGRPPSRA